MVVWIDEIYVKPEFRSQGIGSELIDFVIDKYKDNAARFRLEITESNMGAKKLYLYLRILILKEYKERKKWRVLQHLYKIEEVHVSLPNNYFHPSR